MIRTGTCPWTEKTLVQSGEFYPQGVKTAEARLRFYASQFDTVEVDSTYYALPDVRSAALWAARTPDGFIFHIKAYGALTGHRVNPKTLPKDLKEAACRGQSAQEHVYVREPALLAALAERFLSALQPLVNAGKLGVLVFQYPPWFKYQPSHFDTILKCKELMRNLPIAAEFRHGSWFVSERLEQLTAFFRQHGITYVTADEPQYGTLETIPFVPRLTTDLAYFRLHGRNKENWLKKGIETALRYAYEYSDRELRDLVPPILGLGNSAQQTFVMFNNCYMASGIRNALRMREILKAHGKGRV